MIEGIRVVEFAEGVAGPLAAVRLSDLGARVIKIECAQGDWLRHASPCMPGAEYSAAFFELNRGKRSLALGPHPQGATQLVDGLLERADVFITDRSEAELKQAGIVPGDDFGNRYPRLVMIAISPWGRRGPWAARKGSELTAQAMAGYTRYLGVHGQPARRLGADVASAGTGMFAMQAALAALYRRKRDGKGQRVDVSLLNSLISMKSIHLAAQSDPDKYAGPRVGGANNPPEQGWKTADEPIFFSFGGSVGAEGRPGWVAFIKETGLSHLLDDPRCDKSGRSSTGFGAYVHALRPEYEKAFTRYPARELAERIRCHTGSASVYLRADETLAHPQTRALDIVREVDAGDGRKARIRAFPARFSRLRPALRGNAPLRGEHTAEIASELGFDSATLDRLLAEGALQSAATPETQQLPAAAR
ncbi:MAG: CoA transferase [Betaproteobacteria bacterium]|nr:CoA transferase [Betaproteobacteria bacterium]